MARQVDAEGRALADLAVGEDVAARLLDDAVDGGQAEAGALADILGGEERLEDLGHDLGRHAGAGVLDLDQHVLAGRHAVAGELQALALGDVARADGERAAVGHGVAGVDGEVDDHLLELRLVGLDVPEVAAGQDLELDLLAERAVEQRRDRSVSTSPSSSTSACSVCRREKASSWRTRPAARLALLLDVHDVLVGGVGRPVRLQQQVGEADDGGQHVVEVVRDAAGELADRLHLLALREFQLQRLLLGGVDDIEDGAFARRACRRRAG